MSGDEGDSVMITSSYTGGHESEDFAADLEPSRVRGRGRGRVHHVRVKAEHKYDSDDDERKTTLLEGLLGDPAGDLHIGNFEVGDAKSDRTGKLFRGATGEISPDSIKTGKTDLAFLPLVRDRLDPNTGAVIGKITYREIFNRSVQDARRIKELLRMLTQKNRMKYTSTTQASLERELKRLKGYKPTKLASRCPVYTMAGVDEAGGIQLVGYKNGNDFTATVATVPSGVGPKNGVPRFVAEKGIPECSLMEENVFVNVDGKIQQCVTPKCRAAIAEVKRHKGRDALVGQSRLAQVFKAIANKANSDPGDSILLPSRKTVLGAIGTSSSASKADREFRATQAKTELKDAVREAMVQQFINQGEDILDAQKQVDEDEDTIDEHVQDFIDCSMIFRDGTPSEKSKAKKKCREESSGKCTFYGTKFKTASGAKLPGICTSFEFFREGNSIATKKAGGKAVRTAGDVLLAEQEKLDAELGLNVTLGGGGGGGGSGAASDDRLAVLEAGTTELAALARAAGAMSGGATSPYGESSSRWAL